MNDKTDTEDGRGAKAPPTLEEVCKNMDPDMRYAKFLRMLHTRGMTVTELAKLATKQEKSRSHVIQVLQGRRSGKSTWLFLIEFLTRDEIIVLGKKHLIPVIAPNTIK